MFGLMIHILSRPAEASPDATVTFCVEHALEFIDAHPDVDDDYIQDNTSVSAGSVWIYARDTSGNTLWDGYVASTGCIGTFDAYSSRQYNITVYANRWLTGNYIEVYTDDSEAYAVSHLVYHWSPAPGLNLKTITTPASNGWSALVAGGWSIYRRPAGLSGKHIKFYSQDCPGPSTGFCRCGDAACVDTDSKYIISHETGHLVAYHKNQAEGPNTSYGADYGNCKTVGTRDHEANQREWGGAAAVEGLAHYYAAVAYNNTSTTDCGFAYNKSTDWNLDGVNDAIWVTCEGGPITGVDNADYLADWCDTPHARYGIEWDWLRFWWDMDTDQGVSTTTIFNVYDDADPENWPSGFALTLTPLYFLYGGAIENGVDDEWDNEAFNGVNH